ncbi:MAG: hypothetical protein LBG15_04865 [Dysgonamonadaceae bacterium]|jgi:hypothetical protein|nr:hypothetical protein [Dysgonamonadaceae bacterium]
MAGKLKDDQIRWILSLDAKGVQGELQTLSSTVKRLQADNASLKKEMSAAGKQMKEAASEMARLEKAGQKTSVAYQEAKGTFEAAKEEIASYTQKISENNKAIEENKKKTSEIIREMKTEDMTMSQLRQRSNDLQKQLNNTSAAADPKAYKALQKELGAVNNRMFVVENTGKSMLSQFASMNNPVGSAARAVQGFGQVLTYLTKHPVIATIALIIGLFVKLKDALFKNEEAMNSLNRLMAPMKVLFDGIVNVIQKLVIGFLQFVEVVLSGISKLAEKMPLIGTYIKGINDKAREGIQLEKDKQTLELYGREKMVENAKKETQIAKLRNDVKRKDLYTDEQRIAKLNEAIKLEKEIAETKVYEAKETFRLLELEAKRTENSTEINRKIAEANVAVEQAEKNFYQHTLRMSSELSSTILEMQRERAEAAKKAMENRLKEIEENLTFEINLLKKSKIQGLLTEKEYNDKVEELTMAALHNKINIKSQEKHKIIQYEAEILDAEIKQQEKADAILLDILNKEQTKKLQQLDAGKNAALENLQEKEADQKIYALRAAEIEAEYAKERQGIIESFGSILQQAEFKNNQTRLDAIETNEKEILSAEEKTLKEREALRKLFAKTTADFERQYNIKTWEQRKEDELGIIEKQYAEGLLSKKTYQLALEATDKKYEDEKLKIRQQYGLVSMSEMYQSEMDVLQEQYDKKMLSEEDFQKAQLQIKLKYAQQYTQQAQKFIQAGSDAVKAIEEAETAKIDAEYTKRQSALTEQYNQGIISQEEYNEQKEQLDYEQKSKELELQKKYADVNFAIQVAQILATTAQGIITAWATSMQLGPILGPIMAGAMTVLLGITSIAQVAKAKAERDRVKNMTLEAPGGSSGSSSQTGQIKLKEGFAEGGYNDDDLTPGGYTGKGGKYEVAGYVPVHHGEYVVDTESLKYPDVVEKVRAIDQIRRKHTDKNPLPEGFAEGGSNSSKKNTGSFTVDNKTGERIAKVLEKLENGDVTVQTNYGITELEAAQRRKQEAESKFSKVS